MRDITLLELLSDLKAECGYSSNAAHGVNNRDSLAQVLKRTQRRLWRRDLMHCASQRHARERRPRCCNSPWTFPYERSKTAK
jgi:hypothetical protein